MVTRNHEPPVPGPRETPEAGPAARAGEAVEASPAADDKIQEAVEVAAKVAEETGGLGQPGRPVNRRSPFFIGMMAAAGVAVTYGLVELLIRARGVLILIGLALFIAAGLDPAVSWLTRQPAAALGRGTVVLLGVLGVGAAFLAAAIPPMTSQATAAGRTTCRATCTRSRTPSRSWARLNARYHIQHRLQQLITARAPTSSAACSAPARSC